ncbi:hypothetical protein WJX84_005061 [Apatococcus fuscideae]|uniref:Gag protein n=1 Tax=Apatococcus fuscideae TaxID=2026836 RepID=A0AAW1RRK2_9CHLO
MADQNRSGSQRLLYPAVARKRQAAKAQDQSADPPAPAPGSPSQGPPGAAQFFQHQGTLLPQQAPGAEAPAPSNDVLAIGLEALSPAEAESPLAAIAAAIIDQALELGEAIAAARPAQEGAAPPLPYADDPTVRSVQNSLAFGLHHWGELGSPLAKLSNATWSVFNERLELVLPDVRSGATSSSGIEKAETIADTYASGILEGRGAAPPYQQWQPLDYAALAIVNDLAVKARENGRSFEDAARSEITAGLQLLVDEQPEGSATAKLVSLARGSNYEWSPSEEPPASPSQLQTAINQNAETAKRLVLAGGLVTTEIAAEPSSGDGPIRYLAPPNIPFGSDPRA